MEDSCQLASLISEYSGLVRGTTVNGMSNISTERLVSILSNEHDWTKQGADAVVSLATDYGAFVLRNALALAIALDLEDGALGL